MDASVTPSGAGLWTRRRKAALDAIPPAERTLDDDVLRVTHRFRGLTLEQAVTYLENLGGTRRNRTTVAGDGWRADLSARVVPVGPSYRLTEVSVTWTGDPAVVDPLVEPSSLPVHDAQNAYVWGT